MEKTISAADANRSFSRLLQGVKKGHQYVVTSHGTPVARIIPARSDEARKAGARKALLSRLMQEPAVEVQSWTREELYEDEP